MLGSAEPKHNQVAQGNPCSLTKAAWLAHGRNYADPARNLGYCSLPSTWICCWKRRTVAGSTICCAGVLNFLSGFGNASDRVQCIEHDCTITVRHQQQWKTQGRRCVLHDFAFARCCVWRLDGSALLLCACSRWRILCGRTRRNCR